MTARARYGDGFVRVGIDRNAIIRNPIDGFTMRMSASL